MALQTTSRTVGKKNSARIGLFFVLGFPFGWLVYTAHRYALNVPLEDDFFEFFEAWHRIADAPGIGAKLAHLFEQYGFTEHRRAVVRLMSGTLLALTGQIDCRVFIALGLGWLAWLGWEFYRLHRRRMGLPLVYFIPVAWLLMQPQHLHRGLLWACAHSINLLIILFGFWIVRALAFGQREGFWLACGLTLVAPFIMSNGLFAGWLGVILLVYQRRYREAAGYGTLITALTAAYFIHYHSEFTPRRFEGIGYYLYRFTLLLGGFVNVNEFERPLRFRWLSVGVGTLVLGTYLAAFARTVFAPRRNATAGIQTQQFIVVFGGWLLLTMLALTINRHTYAEDDFLQNRYLIFPITLACLLYVWVLTVSSTALRRVVGLVSGGVAILLWGWHQYQAIYWLDQQRDKLTVSAFEAQRYGTWGIYHQESNYEERINRLTQEMRRRGEYQFPPAEFPAYQLQRGGDSTARRPLVSVRWELRQGKTEVMSRDIPLREADRVFLLLDAPGRTYLLPTQRKLGGHRRYFSTGQRYHEAEFSQVVERGRLPAATYSLRVGVLREGQFWWYSTNQHLPLP